VRETFNTWTPVYLRDSPRIQHESLRRHERDLPGVGVASVLLAGWLSDRLGLNGRSLLLFLGLTGTAAALLVLMSVRSGPSGGFLAVVVIGVVAFCLLGPYSYLGGAFALDFRRQAGERVRPRNHRRHWVPGWCTGGGHCCAALGRVRLEGVFVILAAVSAVAGVCAGGFARSEHRAAARNNPMASSAGLQAYRDSTGVPHHRMGGWPDE